MTSKMAHAALGSLLAALTIPAAIATDHPNRSAKRFPHFERFALLEQNSDTSANVSIGDLNNDGALDIVIAKGRHWPLQSQVFLNDGHGRFPDSHELNETPARTYSAHLIDIRGSGVPDIVLGNDGPDSKLVYFNDGKGNFTVGSSYGRPEWPVRNVAVADLNGDGLPDIIVASRTLTHEGANYICLNRGGGHFDADCDAFSHESATTIAAADLNGDGFIDLVVPNRDGGQGYVYFNDGKADFNGRIPFGPASASMRVAVAADLDGDGRPDIVAIDEDKGVFVYFNRPDGSFSSGMRIASAKSTPYALAAADLKKDGITDIIVGYVNAPCVVYYNDGSGRRFTPVPFGDGKGIAYGIAVGDIDNDGWPDIAVARSDAPNVVYFSSGSK
jgi:hypothetical protein